MDQIKSLKYHNLALFFLSIIAAFLLSQFEPFLDFLKHLGNFGYISAFIAGILFVSMFTMATATVILLILAETLSPIEIGILAGLGAVVGDVAILRFMKDNLVGEVEVIYKRFGGPHLSKILHTKYFRWTLPVIGAIIIALPLPDEIGITLVGLSKIKTYQFLILSFFLNSIGIFLIISSSVVFKP